MKNILILSAGRRVELTQAFMTELKKIFPENRVFAVDMKPNLSAACQIADQSFVAPKATSEAYPHFLMDLCLKYKIGLVVPTLDTDLLSLAENRSEFTSLNINVLISDTPLVKACLDKRETTHLFKTLDIPTPEIYGREAIKFPCFIKPYEGSSSIGANAILNQSMLSDDVMDNDKMLFMEFIDDTYDEYTIDAYYNKEGKLKCFVPRQRLEIRGGEISKGITKRHFVYDYLEPRLRMLKGARGCITLQLFARPTDNAYFAIEINPRFGGGYPLSYNAGANYPRWLIQEYFCDNEVDFFEQWETNLLMLRYDAKILVKNSTI